MTPLWWSRCVRDTSRTRASQESVGGVLCRARLRGGAPTVLLSNAGLLFAPAAHAGALFPGVMPLMVVALAVPMLNERFTLPRRIGVAVITTGVVGLVWGSDGALGNDRFILCRKPSLIRLCPIVLSWPRSYTDQRNSVDQGNGPGPLTRRAESARRQWILICSRRGINPLEPGTGIGKSEVTGPMTPPPRIP